MKAYSLLPAALIVGSLAYGAGAIAGTYGGTFGNGGGGGGAVSALYCALTGCTMTGQTVYSAVSVDITSGTNEDITIAPNGTGSVKLDPSGAGNVDAVPDGTKSFRVLQNSAASTQEIGAEWTVSDATIATYYWRLMNATSADNGFVPTMRSNATCTSAQNCFYFQARMDSGNDSGTVPSMVFSSARADGTALTGRVLLAKFDNGGTGVLNITRGGALAPVPSTTSIADNGGGTNATSTITPGAGAGKINVTCSDAQGCDITLSETNATDGQEVVFRCTATGPANFADTSGVTELAGAFACGQYDTLTLEYMTDRWVETARSNN